VVFGLNKAGGEAVLSWEWAQFVRWMVGISKQKCVFAAAFSIAVFLLEKEV